MQCLTRSTACIAAVALDHRLQLEATRRSGPRESTFIVYCVDICSCACILCTAVVFRFICFADCCVCWSLLHYLPMMHDVLCCQISTAYMYEVLNAKYVYTWEVVGDLSASARDCFRGFNPVTHSTYEDEVQNWSAALLMLADEVASRELPPASSSALASGAGSPAHTRKAGPMKTGAVPSFDPSRPDANPGPRNNAELVG